MLEDKPHKRDPIRNNNIPLPNTFFLPNKSDYLPATGDRMVLAIIYDANDHACKSNLPSSFAMMGIVVF
jgi:hypothetical protein